jgi:hypothetical protein
MTRENFFYQCVGIIEHWLNGNRKLSDLREVTDKHYNEVTKSKWISVEDEYPKEEQLVLACNAKGFFMPAKYSDGIWWFYWNLKSQLLDVVYWMPMPTLPNDYLAEASKEAHRIILEKQPKGGEE